MRRAITLALLGLASPGMAAELPPRAPGFWQTTVTAGPRRTAFTDCVGATDRGFARRLAGTSCGYRITKTPTGHLIESACPLAGGMRATARITIGGQYARAIGGTVVNELLDTRTNKVLSRGSAVLNSRRLRDCAPGDR